MNVASFVPGILIIHAALAVAYVCGSFVLGTRDAGPFRRTAALDLVVTIATGISAIAIVTFFIGIAGLLTPIGLALTILIVCGAGAAALPRTREAAYWRERAGVVGEAFSAPGMIVLWLALVVLAWPAAQPSTSYDAIFYHQVYALEWAQHHQIFVDLFRRFPWYASNWLLIYTWFEVLHFGAYVQFTTWAAGALAAVLAYAVVLGRFERRTLFADLASACAPLPFIVAPVFLRWWDTGMNDVAIGAFFFIAVVAAVANALAPDRRGTIATVILAAFFLGMKPTLPFFFPLFALFLVMAVRTLGATWRHAAIVTAVMAVLASPWYVKNVIQDGDPAPPILHLAMHRDDASFTVADQGNIMSDMVSDRSPGSLALLPVRFFLTPLTNEFREYGTTLVAVFAVVPFLVLGFALVTGRRDELSMWAAALVSAYAYWILSAHYGRYALVFYPLLAVFCVRLLIAGNEWLRAQSRFASAAPATVLVAALGSIVLAEPSPGTEDWYNAFKILQFTATPANTSAETFLRRNLTGFTEEEAVVAWLDAHPALPRRVYSFRLETLAYSFAERNVESIGDWVGPERYTDLKAAVDGGTLPAYLQRFGLSAVLVPRTNEIFKGADLDRLESSLTSAGFRRLETGGTIDAFVRNG